MFGTTVLDKTPVICAKLVYSTIVNVQRNSFNQFICAGNVPSFVGETSENGCTGEEMEESPNA